MGYLPVHHAIRVAWLVYLVVQTVKLVIVQFSDNLVALITVYAHLAITMMEYLPVHYVIIVAWLAYLVVQIFKLVIVQISDNLVALTVYA